MLDAVHQAVNHAFINHAPVMTHTVHNAVVKMLGEVAFKGYEGPCYTQPNQMSFIPMGLTMDPSAFGKGQRRSESVSEPIQMSTTGVTLPSTSPATTMTNLWQNRLNYSGSSALIITIQPILTQRTSNGTTHWSVGSPPDTTTVQQDRSRFTSHEGEFTITAQLTNF
jgi:hypothetical protein